MCFVFVRLFTLVLCLGLSSCLLKKDTGPIILEPQASGFVFENRDFQMMLQVDHRQRQFRWHFRNKSIVTLTLDHRDFQILMGNSNIPYTFWGEPKEKVKEWPMLQLTPGQFITLDYPVLFRSPLFPLPRDQDIKIQITLQWAGRPQTYDFLLEAIKPEVAEEKPTEDNNHEKNSP